MKTPRLRTPSRKLRPVGTKAYSATIVALRKILSEVFGASQAAMAEKAGLSLSLLYRIIQGQREPTPTNIGAVIGAIPRKQRDAALQLMAIYLQDVADETHHGYLVNVESAA